MKIENFKSDQIYTQRNGWSRITTCLLDGSEFHFEGKFDQLIVLLNTLKVEPSSYQRIAYQHKGTR